MVGALTACLVPGLQREILERSIISLKCMQVTFYQEWSSMQRNYLLEWC